MLKWYKNYGTSDQPFYKISFVYHCAFLECMQQSKRKWKRNIKMFLVAFENVFDDLARDLIASVIHISCSFHACMSLYDLFSFLLACSLACQCLSLAIFYKKRCKQKFSFIYDREHFRKKIQNLIQLAANWNVENLSF